MNLVELLEKMRTPENKKHRRDVCRMNNLGAYVGYLPREQNDGNWEIMTVGQRGYVRQKYNGEWSNIESAGTFYQ